MLGKYLNLYVLAFRTNCKAVAMHSEPQRLMGNAAQDGDGAYQGGDNRDGNLSSASEVNLPDIQRVLARAVPKSTIFSFLNPKRHDFQNADKMVHQGYEDTKRLLSQNFTISCGRQEDWLQKISNVVKESNKFETVKVTITITKRDQNPMQFDKLAELGALKSLSLEITVNRPSDLNPTEEENIMNSLTQIKNLTSLKLRGFNDAVVVALAEALKSHTGLTTLDLSFRFHHARDGDAGVEAIAEALKKHTGLTTLNLEENRIGDAGAEALAEALKKHTGLTTLDLWGNREIGDAGAKALAEALKEHTGLTTLNLGRNIIGDAGAEALAEALKKHTGLTTLNLEENRMIGDAGAKALAEALKEHTGLTNLNLGGNIIGDAGAEALAEALKSHTGLTTLELETNEIGDAGVEAIAEALKKHTGLTWLNLGANRIGDAGVLALAEALKKHTGLTALKLSFTSSCGDAGVTALAEALQKHTGLTKMYLIFASIGGANAFVAATGSWSTRVLGGILTETSLEDLSSRVGLNI